jgi:large conductance mechanosensitive channel
MDKEDEMLEELKKIRAAVEKPPAPVTPQGLWNEFKDFLSKYRILGLAAGFVLGLYLGTLVQSLVKDFILPAIGLVIPGLADLASYNTIVMKQVFHEGDFLVSLVTFIIVAFVVFLIVKVAKRWSIE